MSLNDPEDLFQRKPYLQLYFADIPKVEENPFQLLSAKKEGEYLLALQNRKLASGISPRTQAFRSLPQKAYPSTDLLVVLGLGNPHLLTAVDSFAAPGQIVLFVDFHIDVFYPLWQAFLQPILEKEGRHIFCGEHSLSLLWNYIDSLPIERLSGIRYLQNPSSISLAPDYYREIENRIHQIFSSKMSDLLTKFEFERIWVKNTLCNAIGFHRQSLRRYKVQSLLHKYDKLPAVLVSAGPTLRHHCEWLKTVRDKVFVMSCDTSLKVLKKFGITPDAVITLDAQTHSIFHFLGEDLGDVPVFADMVTSPALIRKLQCSSLVHSITAKFQVDAAGKPVREVTAGSETAEELIGKIGDIQSGGSVATTAFDVLHQMGCSPIFLIGQDLAYTGREIHSTGIHHNEKWLSLMSRRQTLEKINETIVRKRKTEYIPSCNGGTVLTDYVLKIYKQWFEESAGNLSLPIYNVNTGGAFLENIENITKEQATPLLQDYPEHGYPWRDLPPWNLSENIQEGLAPASELKQTFLGEIHRLREDLQNLASGASTEALMNTLKERLTQTPYIKLMLRKIEVYLRRHDQGLSPERKKEIFVGTLRKEIRFLKKGILAESDL
ncbi:MAG: 6-hydroxymethylpterin diphosphokinase MptE-like protein [Spirochaetota bacterium]